MGRAQGCPVQNSHLFSAMLNGEHHSDRSQNPSMKQLQTLSCFQMPLHYPRYKKSDYETMPEWQLDRLLNEYGLPVAGDAEQKRKFAMGAFLWPSDNK